jgi:asparagine synthase (glutamine-hydrolysing)
VSGICGIVNLDGAPVDRQLLQGMTAFMAFRGPEAQSVWVDRHVGFGHAMLCTTFESERERQPFSFEGKVWITADARVDGRDELKQKLTAKDRRELATATDVELILHAYHAWGEDCVQHLIGDFAFAVWDGPRRQLFCARDHFGVKPFFYARLGQCLVFSNTLNCVRQHPAVSDTLDDLAIADFLLFENFQDPLATAFADIRRLPPAQRLTWSANGLQSGSYWTLPTNLGVRYRAAGDYVERFSELLGIAVADRLRTKRVGVEMSGGLDSPAVAATASALLRQQSPAFDVQAVTIVYDRLIPDEERYYSGLVAQGLGIPIHYIVGDEYKLQERCDRPETQRPEPVNGASSSLALSVDFLGAAAARSRVFLTGWDGDALLSESPKPYFRALLNDRQIGRLLAGVMGCVISEWRLVPRSFWNRLNPRPKKDANDKPSYPVWLNPELEQRYDLRARWDQVNAVPSLSHPLRPHAYRCFSLLRQLSGFFDYYDAGATRRPLEFRHPLLDLRLLDYCLTLPPYPWCVKKEILRASMRDVLPEPVRLRPKTPLAGLVYPELLRRAESESLDRFVAVPEMTKYVVRARIPPVHRETDVYGPWINLRPLSLNFWLQSLRQAS